MAFSLLLVTLVQIALVITKKDKQHDGWKKQVPALRGEAIELGTEAGIDILLYCIK